MSSYTTSSPVYSGTLIAIRNALPELERQAEAICQGLASRLLTDLLNDVKSAQVHDPAAMADLWAHVAQTMPTWEHAFTTTTYDDLSSLPTTIASLGTLEPDAVQVGTQTAVNDLVTALESAVDEVANYEQQITATAVGLALGDLGYAVDSWANDEHQVTGYAATRGDETILVEVTSGGIVNTDHVGMSDAISCGEAQADLVEQTEAYGVALVEEERDDHRDPRGGSLAARIARSRHGSLAERIVTTYVTERPEPGPILTRQMVRQGVAR